DIAEVQSIFSKGDPSTIVPIVLTSAVKGSGIRKLHALLRYIPLIEDTIPIDANNQDSVFYVDEVFAKHNATDDLSVSRTVSVLSGHLCYHDLE
uniref:hypothetical protein n=1 Tax=Salmonella sp. s36468 TaxID=3159641 RepID=UPI00397FAB76